MADNEETNVRTRRLGDEAGGCVTCDGVHTRTWPCVESPMPVESWWRRLLDRIR